MNPEDLYEVRQESFDGDMLDAMVEYMLLGREAASK